mmetsp:Transcript_18049/g.44911  ORF Transcript_18049/g.44911 Transcript_18049/m.44911 type:complete len:219 (+) Transcript_18049:1589-2245(+)
MANVSPCMSGNIAPRNCGAFRKVEGDLFGCYPRLELSHLRMFPAPPKCTRWFHVVVSNLFYVPVYLRISELEHGLVAIIFVGLAFLVGNSLSDDLLLLQVFPNGCKVAFFKVLDYVTSAKSRFKICKEIFDKDLCRLWIPQVHSIGIHRGKKCGSFLFYGGQIYRLSVVFHSNSVRHIGFREAYSRVFHLFPLASFRWILGVPPQEGLHCVLESFRLI